MMYNFKELSKNFENIINNLGKDISLSKKDDIMDKIHQAKQTIDVVLRKMGKEDEK